MAQSMSFFSALKYASAGLVALLLYLYPFIVTVLGALVLRQRLGRRRLLAVLAALFGTALTLGAGGGFAGEARGVALGLTAALIYAIYTLVGGRVLVREDALACATVVMIAAAAVFIGFSAWHQPVFPHTALGWAAIAAIAVVCTVVAMLTYFIGIRQLGAADAATLSTLEPAVTIVLAAVFLDEAFAPLQALGAVIILAAVVWLMRTGAR